MKKFMLIFISKEYSELGLSPEQMQERMGKWFAWNNDMKEKGISEDGHALHGQARIIAGADRTVTDRAATEVKELVGGYYVINAKDFDAAAEVAQGYPDYDLGGKVEIREIVVFN